MLLLQATNSNVDRCASKKIVICGRPIHHVHGKSALCIKRTYMVNDSIAIYDVGSAISHAILDNKNQCILLLV